MLNYLLSLLKANEPISMQYKGITQKQEIIFSLIAGDKTIFQGTEYDLWLYIVSEKAKELENRTVR